MKKAVIFQLFLIVLMLVVAVLPLKFGTPMQIQTRLYDPRDLFRGNYLDLNYDFLTISKSGEFSKLHAGDTIYAVFEDKKDEKSGLNLKQFANFSSIAPKDAPYLSGRISGCNISDEYCHVKYGIEKYFLPIKKAIDAENDMQNSTAHVNLGVLWGFARIESLEVGANKY